MTNTQESSSKITNPESITRLMTTMCEGSMPVLIRHQDSGKVTIRGSLIKIGRYKQASVVLLGKISELGLSRLDLGVPLKIEVLGMTSQLTFTTIILEKARDGMICAMPRSLISTERRHNTRHKMTQTLTSFMSFSFWKAMDEDFGSPPVLSSYSGIGDWISVVDISAGGVCLMTRFPSFMNAVERVTEDEGSFLHIPMSPPIPLKSIVRWKRKIKNRFEDEDVERYQLEFRIGIEFLDLTEEQKQKIKHFIRQLTIAEAI